MFMPGLEMSLFAVQCSVQNVSDSVCCVIRHNFAIQTSHECLCVWGHTVLWRECHIECVLLVVVVKFVFFFLNLEKGAGLVLFCFVENIIGMNLLWLLTLLRSCNSQWSIVPPPPQSSHSCTGIHLHHIVSSKFFSRYFSYWRKYLFLLEQRTMFLVISKCLFTTDCISRLKTSMGLGS